MDFRRILKPESPRNLDGEHRPRDRCRGNRRGVRVLAPVRARHFKGLRMEINENCRRRFRPDLNRRDLKVHAD